jgi:hypothetical protein
MGIAGWELPGMTTVMDRHDSEALLTSEIPESVFR